MPITKDQAMPSTATNNPEIYHHLREDFDVKDRNNYYYHAMPLNGQQKMEPEHYGNLQLKKPELTQLLQTQIELDPSQ